MLRPVLVPSWTGRQCRRLSLHCRKSPSAWRPSRPSFGASLQLRSRLRIGACASAPYRSPTPLCLIRSLASVFLLQLCPAVLPYIASESDGACMLHTPVCACPPLVSHRSTARAAKTSVEQAQRDLRKAKEAAGDKHSPTCFTKTESGEWIAAPDAIAQCLADCA